MTDPTRTYYDEPASISVLADIWEKQCAVGACAGAHPVRYAELIGIWTRSLRGELTVKIGVVFPQTEIGADPDVVAKFATTAESLGYDHLLAYDHVLGANTASRPDWQGPYTTESMFQEPLVLFSYLAGLTSTIELVTAVLILPQRQTALVAKQAACVDVLSKGRLRLGVGTGWNDVDAMWTEGVVDALH